MKKKSLSFFLFIFLTFVATGYVWNLFTKKINAVSESNIVDKVENSKEVSQFKNRIINSHEIEIDNANVKSKILKKKDLYNEQKIIPEVQKAKRAIQNIEMGKLIKRPTRIQFDSTELINESILQFTSWKRIKNVQIRDNSDISLNNNQDVIIKIGQWVFLKVENNFDLEETIQNFNTKKPIPVFDPRLSQIGYITGSIVIIVKNRNLLINFLLEVDAEIKNSFENINTYYISSKKKLFNLDELYSQSRSRFGSEFVKLEINEKKYDKN